MLCHVGLVSRTRKLGFAELAPVAAALQKQVLRDFAPLWNITGTVDAFAGLEDVPSDYWVVTIEEFNGTGGFAGIHGAENFQPFARVAYSNVWSLTASHEVLEMLADPFRSSLLAGASIEHPERRVQYLVEICDPCQDPAFAYPVNGVMVSDFVSPQYFDPVAAAGVRYSYSGAISAPHGLADGGYLTWLDTDGWRQAALVGAELQFSSLDLPKEAMALRDLVDRARGKPPWWRHGLPESDSVLQRFRRVSQGVKRSAHVRAEAIKHQLAKARARRRRRRPRARSSS